ncbi:MAG: TonB-dependent receptor [Candidatus Aminicenantes bacterium]|jgi:outer membrane receptor protein involved in Fe transport
MVKKLFYVFMAFLFICAFTITTTPVYAQEEEEEVIVEDVADISLEDLLNVEITTAGKRPEKIGEIPASVVVVTREDIETYGYQTLSEILENIPGLYLINDYSYTSFGVRGFWTTDPQRNVIILVNDVKQREGVFNANLIEQINVPPEAIERIEVVRGPMSVIYGSGAFFGAINIKTRLEDAEPVSIVSGAYSSQKSARVFARAAGTEGDLQYAFNGSYYDTEGIDADMENIAGPALAGLTTKELLENTETYFDFSGKFKDFLFDASYTEARKETMFLLPPVSEYSFYTTRATRLAFHYDKQISDQVKVNAKFTYSRLMIYFNFDFLIPDLYAEQDAGSNYNSGELTLFYEPSPKLSLTLGAGYEKFFKYVDQIKFPFLGVPLYNLEVVPGDAYETRSAYIQLNFKPSKTFKITAGARIEQAPEFEVRQRTGHVDPTDQNFATYTTSNALYSRTDVEFIPRIALIFLPTEKHSIKLLYGQALNRPSFQQIMDTVFVAGVDALVPETIQTVEMNYIGTLSQKFTLGLSLFYNILDKLIYRSQVFIGGQYISTFSNVGEITTAGAELTLTAKPSESFQLELSGTYQDTRDKREGFADIDVGYAPKFLGYFKAALFLTKDISIAVNGTYVDEMYAYYDDTLDPPGRIGEKVDSYFLLGANLRIRNLFGTGMFLNIKGSNLMDEEIHYPTTSNNSGFAALGTIGRGRTFLFTVGYRFIPLPMPQPQPQP